MNDQAIKENPLKKIDFSDKEEKISQAEQSYRYIKEAILDLSLEAGQNLSENQLSDILNMSRTPIREAIQRLNNEGLVETIKYKGTFVREFSQKDINQIYEMAEALESMVVYLAAQKATEQDIKQMKEIVNEMKNAQDKESVSDWMEADQEFHTMLPLLSKNTLLINDLTNLYEKISIIRLRYLNNVGIIPKSTKDHIKTIKAIEGQEAKLAREITQKHWEDIRKRTTDLFNK